MESKIFFNNWKKTSFLRSGAPQFYSQKLFYEIIIILYNAFQRNN